MPILIFLAHLWRQATEPQQYTEIYRRQEEWLYQGNLYKSLDDMLDAIYNSQEFQEEEHQWRALHHRLIDVGQLEQGIVPHPGHMICCELLPSFFFRNYASEKRDLATQERAKTTPRLRYKIFQRDSFRCQICGASSRLDVGVRLEVDHRLPVSRGGRTEESNLWTLCMSCNRGKYTDIL